MKSSSPNGQIPALRRYNKEEERRQDSDAHYHRDKLPLASERRETDSKPSQQRRKHFLTVKVGSPEHEDDISDLDGDDADTEDDEILAKKHSRTAVANRCRAHEDYHNGMVLSPSVPSFCRLDDTPESSTPSPLETTTGESSPQAKDANGKGVHRLVKTRSLPFISLVGVRGAKANEEDAANEQPVSHKRKARKSSTQLMSGIQKDDSVQPVTIRPSASFGSQTSDDSHQYMQEMASKVANASCHSVTTHPSFMTALQKPSPTVGNGTSMISSNPHAAYGPSLTPPILETAGTARTNPHAAYGPSLTPPIVEAAGTARSHRLSVLSSSLSVLPKAEEEKSSDSSSDAENDHDSVVPISKTVVRGSSNELATSAVSGTPTSSEPKDEEESSTMKKKMRLFNIFSPMFVRFRRKRKKNGFLRKSSLTNVTPVSTSSSSSSSSGSLDGSVERPEESVGNSGLRTESNLETGLKRLSVDDSVSRDSSAPSLPGIKITSISYGENTGSVEEVEEDYWKECGTTRSTDELTSYSSSESFLVEDAEPDHSCADDITDEFDEEESEDDEEEDQSFDPYVFMGRLQRFVDAMPKFMRSAYFVYPVVVPLLDPVNTVNPKPTLVLDLDETLVHCSVEPVASPDFIFPVSYDGNEFRVHAYKRPHLRSFLKRVSEMFEVVLFTASLPQYAEALVRVLDPTQEIFSYCLFRNACVQGFGSFIKDLSLLGRDLSKTVIIDNSPQAFSFQPDNGIPIRSYFDSKDDRELPKLIPFLQRLAQAEDVRPLLCQRYKVSEKIEHALSLGKQP